MRQILALNGNSIQVILAQEVAQAWMAIVKYRKAPPEQSSSAEHLWRLEMLAI